VNGTKKKLQLLFTSRNCAVCSFLDFFNDTKSYASYVTSYNVTRSDKLVWMRKHTEVYGEDLNVGYPKYEAQILTTTLQHTVHIRKIMAQLQVQSF